MSEYMFGVTTEAITKSEGKRRDRIARKHGANFIGPITIPGSATRGWFAGPNRGDPFDSDLRRAVMSECGLA